MSAFCVFGMTEALAKKAAERAWKKHLEGLAHDVRKHLTPEDEAEWLKVKTEYFLAKGKPVAVSAPLRRPSVCAGLHQACQQDHAHISPAHHVPWPKAGQERRPRHQQDHQEGRHRLDSPLTNRRPSLCGSET